jgi:hypothetical protein
MFFLSLPGTVKGLIPLVYETTRHELTSFWSARVEHTRVRNADLELRRRLDADWNRTIWRNAVPLCLLFEEKGLTNSCPAPLAVKYCWLLPSDQDWGIKHTNCDQNQHKWTITNPGFTGYEPRPWCRSYGFCASEVKVLCAVKTVDVTAASARCG